MRKYLIVVLLLAVSIPALATDQVSDVFLYRGERCRLVTHWAYYAPLEIYFRKNKKRYPFKPKGTANYRGHVATWELSGKSLFLKSVRVGEDEYGLERIFEKYDKKKGVKATWFTGIAKIITSTSKVKDEDGYIYWFNYAYIYFEKGNLKREERVSYKRYMKEFGEYYKNKDKGKPAEKGPVADYIEYTEKIKK